MVRGVVLLHAVKGRWTFYVQYPGYRVVNDGVLRGGGVGVSFSGVGCELKR